MTFGEFGSFGGRELGVGQKAEFFRERAGGGGGGEWEGGGGGGNDGNAT